jgi:hypothetical protein
MKAAPLLAAVALASCQPQVGTGYLGEPLISLRGLVVSSGTTPLEAAMLWQRGDPPSTNDEELATRAPVEAGFPATFTVSLYQPPPAAARRSLAPGEPIWARANAGAVPYGVAGGSIASLPASGNPSYGIDANHWVLYLDSDVRPGSLTEWWLGAPLAAGYHLLRVAAVDPQCITPDTLAACEADLAQRGVADPAAAKAFCLEPYRLAPAPPGELLVLDLGTVGLGPVSGTCP